jgi:hypothetical protein
MTKGAKVLKGSDGRERVLLDLVEFQALLNAARRPEAGLPELGPLIRKLEGALAVPAEEVDLERFLADYDAAHGERS